MAVLTPGRKEEGVALYHAFCEQLHPVLCPAPFDGIREALDALRRKHIRVAGAADGLGAHSEGAAD